jgi:hypothetical protein
LIEFASASYCTGGRDKRPTTRELWGEYSFTGFGSAIRIMSNTPIGLRHLIHYAVQLDS